MKFSIVLIAALILLNLVDRFLFSFGKMQLFGLWLMQEQAAGLSLIGADLDTQQIFVRNKYEYSADIVDMLASASNDSLQSKVALAFADQVKDLAEVQAQLTVIASQHPAQKVRCYWQQQLEQGALITIVNNPGENQQVSNYLLLPETGCPLKNTNKPITMETF